MSTVQRTYSSPDLKANPYRFHSSRWESQQDKYGYGAEEDSDQEFYVIGDRVYVDGFRPASVAYFGEVGFAGGDWVGVVLDDPTGNHGGKIHGRKYFQCAPNHGLFVKPRRVRRIAGPTLSFSAASSRTSTPFVGRHSCNSRSPGSSLMDSYYYDDDFRQERVPTVASLTRKLRSINDQAASDSAHRQTSSRQGSISTTPTTMTSITRTGILKGSSPRSHSTEPISISDRTGELARRLNQAAQSSSPSRSPVFNFRPRRAKLDEYERLRGVSASTSPISGSPIQSRLYKTVSSKSVDLSSEPPKQGDRVIVRSDKGEMTGILRYLGETNFATGEWAGVELDHPDGKNDGSVLNYRYFHCPQNYGLFVPAVRVMKKTSRSPEFKSVRSTLKSPPPLASAYNSRSTTPSSKRASSSLYSSSSAYSSDKTRAHTPSSSLTSPIASSHDQLAGQRSSLFYDDSRPLRENSNILNSSRFGSTRGDGTYSSSLFIDSERRPKFDDNDIERELRKSLQKPSSHNSYRRPTSSSSIFEKARPKAIKYTFSSSKYDGNPIVRRTLEYD